MRVRRYFFQIKGRRPSTHSALPAMSSKRLRRQRLESSDVFTSTKGLVWMCQPKKEKSSKTEEKVLDQIKSSTLGNELRLGTCLWDYHTKNIKTTTQLEVVQKCQPSEMLHGSKNKTNAANRIRKVEKIEGLKIVKDRTRICVKRVSSTLRSAFPIALRNCPYLRSSS